MNRALLTCLTCGLAAVVALSQPGAPVARKDKDEQRTFVLIAGISTYADKEIKPRPKAEADARALYQLFTDKKYASGANVTLLVGNPEKGETKATREAFLKALKKVAEDADVNDLVVLAFIGQGGPLGDAGDRRCYFLADSNLKDRDKTAVAAEEIESALKKLKSKRFVALVDVDFKGFDTGPARWPSRSRPSARRPTASSWATTAPTSTGPCRAGRSSWRPTACTPRST